MFLQSMYVGDKTSDKLEPVHARMYVQRAGTSSHTKAVTKYLRYYTDIQALELGGYPSIKSIGNCMKNIIYNNPGLSVSMICSGWDPYEGF
jgi:20S proteasome alpha/beta subunit